MEHLSWLSANGSNEKWFGASAGFYPETIEQSLRFDGSTSKLERTPSTDGDRKNGHRVGGLKGQNLEHYNICGPVLHILVMMGFLQFISTLMIKYICILIQVALIHMVLLIVVYTDTTNWSYRLGSRCCKYRNKGLG